MAEDSARTGDRLRSFGRRRTKRLQGKRRDSLESLLPEYAITLPPEAGGDNAGILDLSAFFSFSPREIWLEIGFGGGEHLAAQAGAHADIGFIGCEPFMDGVAKLLIRAQEEGLSNLRVFPEDVRLLLERLPDASLARVFILFPDPWPKQRHHKRRLVNEALLNQLARALKPGGVLLLATDHAGYAQWMLEHLLADERFEWTARGPEDFNDPPEGWVVTRYQEKAALEGRKPCFLLFERKPA